MTRAIAARPRLMVTSPQANAVIKGMQPFAVRFQHLPRLASIEYDLNGRSLSGPLTLAPYSYIWNSASVWDGPATLHAIARDAAGAVLAESAAVSFIVANGSATIRMVSPDPAHILRGAVRWAVEAERPMLIQEMARKRERGSDVKSFEALIFLVDGWPAALSFGSSNRTIDLDTTQYANGRHELFVAAYSTEEGVPPVAMLQVPVIIDNGHRLRDVRPRWRDLFLAPGEKADLTPRLIYTDGAERPLTAGATVAGADPSIATVSANGTVTAVAPGVTQIHMEARGHKTSTRVIVDTPHGFPHFSGDGHILTEYDPARSLFVRSLFTLTPDELDHTPGLAAQAHAAAINTLTTGFYFNPAEGHQPDFDTWRKGWEPWWNKIAQRAKDYGFGLILTGDDIARTRREMINSITNPWSAEAIQLALTKARDSNRVVCIEMMDEASALWGDTPTPTDGRWLKKDSSVPDDAFIKLMKIINGVKDRPPITWSVVGLAGPDAARNWMGNPAFADYASQYWTYMDWRRAYPWGASLPQDRAAVDRVVIGRFPALQRHAPELLLTSLTGPYYTAHGSGHEYTPGQDRLIAPATPPVSVAAQVMYAAAMGMAGVRAYAFDWSVWKKLRREAKPGQGDLQTGSDPFETGTDRWQAMASAFDLIQRLEPDLLQPQMSAVDLGRSIVTGARQGPRSRLLMAINFSEAAEPARVYLGPYRHTDGPPIVRYRLVGATLSTATVRNRDYDAVTFAPGEAIVWQFLSSPDDRPAPHKTREIKDTTPPMIALASPLPNSTVAGQVIVRANVADDAKVRRVDFFVDGRAVATIKARPYKFTWDTTEAKTGFWHSLAAVAYDIAENSAEARIAVQIKQPTDSTEP